MNPIVLKIHVKVINSIVRGNTNAFPRHGYAMVKWIAWEAVKMNAYAIVRLTHSNATLVVVYHNNMSATDNHNVPIYPMNSIVSI